MTASSTAEREALEELQRCLSDPMWRITSGKLYKILIKGDGEEEGLTMAFTPNRAQKRFLKRMWHRNVILKARQLGFTTLICILWLDHALFNADSRCGIIAQDRETAESLFLDKVKFAYDNLPEILRNAMPLVSCTKSEMHFAHNNSRIRVATSVRSGTIHRLHISEFGKICAKFPDKAREVVTGSIPAVPKNGILVIESTAEGRDGEFAKISHRAEKSHKAKKTLTLRDYRFHFFPWHDEPGYRMNPEGVIITVKDHDYFNSLEAKENITIDIEQRAWYVATREADFSGAEEKMYQEYPSTPDEAFHVSVEGCYYSKEMATARKTGRITKVPLLPNVPCNTFWDIGSSDGTAIWVHQRIGQQNNIVRFYEAWGEPYSHFVKWLNELGVIFDTHYLPHDADHERQGQIVNDSPRDMLSKLMPGHRFDTVERVQDINWGIQQTRDVFPTLVFDEEHCKDGIDHLDAYKKRWNERQAVWSDQPDKSGGHSEAADALRQLAQGYKPGTIRKKSTARKNENWRTN